MIGELLKPEVEDMLRLRRWGEVRDALSDCSPPELADVMRGLAEPLRPILFRSLGRAISSELFSHLEFEEQDALLRQLTSQETRHLLSDMSPDDRTALLSELPARATRRMLNLLSPEDLKEARLLLGYPDESVGRLMTPDYVYVRKTWTVGRALEAIRRHGHDSETTNMVYVVDDGKKLLDELPLRRIILAGSEQTIEELMDGSVVSLSAYEDREQAVGVMRKYDLVSIPVVDSDGCLLGIVTVDDVMDVAEEEATEDIQKTASVVPLRGNYQTLPIWKLYQKRVGWLVALVLVNMVSSGIIAMYEATLAATLSLAMFIPLLIGSGGNTGSQSATLIIRALTTGEVALSNWLTMLVKELWVGISLGLTLGVVTWFLGFYKGGATLGLIVSLSMVAVVLFANIIGLLLPLLLTRLRMDPAVAGSPLVTTVTDAGGLVIFFTFAKLLLA